MCACGQDFPAGMLQAGRLVSRTYMPGLSVCVLTWEHIPCAGSLCVRLHVDICTFFIVLFFFLSQLIKKEIVGGKVSKEKLVQFHQLLQLFNFYFFSGLNTCLHKCVRVITFTLSCVWFSTRTTFANFVRCFVPAPAAFVHY